MREEGEEGRPDTGRGNVESYGIKLLGKVTKIVEAKMFTRFCKKLIWVGLLWQVEVYSQLLPRQNHN